MKKVIYALILPLLVVSGLVLANHRESNEASEKPAPKPLSAAEKELARRQWEANPEGVKYKQWEASPAGKKVYAGEAKIRQSLRDFTDMEAVITSLTLPPGSRLGFGVMARINDEDYLLSFGLEEDNEFQQLRGLKVGDKIIVRSRNVSHAPKYAYPILRGDYIEQNGEEVYQRVFRRGGC